MFTLVHWDDWRLLVLEIVLAIVVIVGIMWLARLANTGGPPQAKASASGGDERPEADPPETRTEGSNTAQQTKR